MSHRREFVTKDGGLCGGTWKGINHTKVNGPPHDSKDGKDGVSFF